MTTIPDTIAELLAATQVAALPDITWLNGDEKCDCTYQRIGFWTNPYIAQTLEVRLCCLFAEFQKAYPDLFRETDAFWDYNRGKWVTEPQDWDSEDMPMPVYLWHRQLARKTGKSLQEIRAEYQGKESQRPQKIAGRRTRNVDASSRIAAMERELRATGWIVGDEKVVIKAGKL